MPTRNKSTRRHSRYRHKRRESSFEVLLPIFRTDTDYSASLRSYKMMRDRQKNKETK